MSKKAIIDLGSNTFHLLIAQSKASGDWEILLKKRTYVFLAEKGTHHIYPEAWSRAMDCLQDFRHLILQHEVEDIVALGTAALRAADNSEEFTEQVHSDFRIPIRVISGNDEAKLIAKGVMSALNGHLSEYLIMDIGGGSVEFVLVEDHQAVWEQSFPIGLSELKRQDFYNDPFDHDTSFLYHQFLDEQLHDLTELLDGMTNIPLVGASGTFDAVLSILTHQEMHHFAESSVSAFKALFEQVKFMPLAERLNHPDIPNKRAPLYNLALLLVFHVLERYPIDALFISHFGMKEGAL
jgi:exopolyphosphatase/guanosine-5'-triphosphate,3'-diphosphate pyrophosphatase